MSAEKIIEQIKKDAQKKVKEILIEAEKQAKNLSNDSRQEAEEKAEKVLSDGRKQSEKLRKILVSKADQDTKKEIMNAREKIIEECFIKAHHKLSTLSEKEYKETVAFLMRDGSKKLGGECTVIISRDADKKIAENMGLKVTGNVESSGGIILQSNDGRVTLDHTFDGILKREKDKIRIMVGKLLFSKDAE